jgi:hypothetical protein
MSWIADAHVQDIQIYIYIYYQIYQPDTITKPSFHRTGLFFVALWVLKQFWLSFLPLSFASLPMMGAFCTITFEVGVFHRIVSSLTISFSITCKLTLLLLCLLSTTPKSTTGTKKLIIIMTTLACNQVMNDGSDLEGIQILFQYHLIPEFIPLSKSITMVLLTTQHWLILYSLIPLPKIN